MQYLYELTKRFHLTIMILAFSLPCHAQQRAELEADWLSKIKHAEVSVIIPQYPVNVLLPPSRDIVLDFARCHDGLSKTPRAAIGFNDPIPSYFKHIKLGEGIKDYDPYKLNKLLGHEQLRQTLYADIKEVFSQIPARKTTFIWTETPISATTLLHDSNKRLAAGKKLPNVAIQLSVRVFFNNVSADPIFSRLWMATDMKIYTLPNAKPKTRLRKKTVFTKIYEQRFVSNYDLRKHYTQVKQRCPANSSEQITSILYENNAKAVQAAIDSLRQNSRDMIRQFFIDDPIDYYKRKSIPYNTIFFSPRLFDKAIPSESSAQAGEINFDPENLTAYWKKLTKAQAKRILRRDKEAGNLYLKRKLFYNSIDARVISTDAERIVLLDRSKTYYSLAKKNVLITSADLYEQLATSAREYIESNF